MSYIKLQVIIIHSGSPVTPVFSYINCYSNTLFRFGKDGGIVV